MHTTTMLGILMVFVSLVALGDATGNMDPRVSITETVPSDKGTFVVEGFIAEDVTLTCFVDNMVDDLDVRWQVVTKDNTKPKLISVDMDIQDNNKWSIEKPTAYSWRLRIKALQIQDEGNYTCYVQLTIDTRVQANRTVLSFERPAIIEEKMSSDETIKEGENKELVCGASGRPEPTLIWRREGNAILPDGGVVKLGAVLAITDAKYMDRGTYICKAYNKVGQLTRKIFVDIEFSPKLTGKETLAQAVGYRRTMVCYVEANPQPRKDPSQLQLYWTKGNRAITQNDRINYRILEGAYSRIIFELIFKWVTEEDFGEYICTVKNSLGDAKRTFTLTKSDTPVPDKGGVISAAVVPYSHLMTLFGTLFVCLGFTYKNTIL